MKKISVYLEDYLVDDLDCLLSLNNDNLDLVEVKFKSRSEFISYLLHVAIFDKYVILRDYDSEPGKEIITYKFRCN